MIKLNADARARVVLEIETCRDAGDRKLAVAIELLLELHDRANGCNAPNAAKGKYEYRRWRFMSCARCKGIMPADYRAKACPWCAGPFDMHEAPLVSPLKD